jgi:hypothetical protein
MTEKDCPCLRAPLPFDQYEQVLHPGIDETNGRFGEVSALTRAEKRRAPSPTGRGPQPACFENTYWVRAAC